MEGNLNRRSFVKGAALSAAGLIAGGALAACSPAAGTSESKSETAQTTGANNAEQRWSCLLYTSQLGNRFAAPIAPLIGNRVEHGMHLRSAFPCSTG